MIIEIRAKNCYAFEDDITFSMKADMRNKKFGANVHKENNFNVLKTVGIYGPNNAGKTCLIKCIRAIRNVLLNKKNGLMPNIFTDSDVCELGVTFMASGRKFLSMMQKKKNIYMSHFRRYLKISITTKRKFAG